MADLTVKRFDTYPPMIATLSDANGPVDLTTATAVKVIFSATSTVHVITGACTFLAPRTNGQVQYQWSNTDLATADLYNVEFEVTWPGGTETFPNDAYKTLLVVADLENA